jgi:hypothetical protein
MRAARADISLKNALFNQYNIILVGGAILFALAVGSRVPLIAAAVAEVSWLAVGRFLPPFNRWASSQGQAQDAERWAAETEAAAKALDPEPAARVRAVGNAAAEIWRLAQEHGHAEALGNDMRDKLGMVVGSYARMASVYQRLSRFLGDSRTSGVEEELVRLGQALADEKDPGVRLSLRQALAVGQRRLRQLEQIESTRRGLDVKMSTLQMSFEYVRSQVFSGAGPDELATAIDEMVASTGFVPEVEAEAAASLSRVRVTTTTFVG